MYSDTSKRNILEDMWDHAHEEITSLQNDGDHKLIDEESNPRRAEIFRILRYKQFTKRLILFYDLI